VVNDNSLPPLLKGGGQKSAQAYASRQTFFKVLVGRRNAFANAPKLFTQLGNNCIINTSKN